MPVLIVVRRGSALALLPILLVAVLASPSEAGHMKDWRHDHRTRAIPRRPVGYSELVKRFGNRCSGAANDARTWFPHAVSRGKGGYVYYHSRLARNVGGNIRKHIAAAHRNGALDYGIYGYNCRRMRGSTKWSVHAWGAAVDTNTYRNPQRQRHWDGRGADGVNYGTYIPHVWKGKDPGHRFLWGKHFNTPDPHHFQYVSGY